MPIVPRTVSFDVVVVIKPVCQAACPQHVVFLIKSNPFVARAPCARQPRLRTQAQCNRDIPTSARVGVRATAAAGADKAGGAREGAVGQHGAGAAV